MCGIGDYASSSEVEQIPRKGPKRFKYRGYVAGTALMEIEESS